MLDGKYVLYVNDMIPVTRLISPYERFGRMVRQTDNDIARSQSLVMSSSPDGKPTGQEALYVEGMKDAEFKKLLRQKEDSQKPSSITTVIPCFRRSSWKRPIGH